MQNLKIKVNTAEESKEVQELFFELGASWCYGKHLNENIPHDRSIILHNFGTQLFWAHVYEHKNFDDAKETTLAELRSIVVLKRNDIEDATHACESIHHRRGYLSIDGVEYTWSYGQDKWIKSEKSFNENGLKPIEKNMQEYLNTNTYEYKLAHTKPDGDWVCIPEGAVEARLNRSGSINFINRDSDYMNGVTGGEWVSTHRFKHDDAGHKIIWQRPAQPEALPFIDDNPQSLNEQYAEIEQVRQQSIEATIAERQSTYGSFEDVAFATENIMSVLGHVRANGLNELPNTHRMALYMIASKMARIVNGDFNHIDGWHDIGGYAKLVEDLIKDNNNGY